VRSDIFKDHNLYPFSGSIKEHFQAHFDAAFIALMPFTDKHLVELDMTVQESLKSVKPIGWSQVIEAVEFFGTKEVAKALKSLNSVYEPALEREALADRLYDLREEKRIFPPMEGEYDAFSKVAIYKGLKLLGKRHVVLMDEFYEGTSKIDLEKLSEIEFTEMILPETYYIFSEDKEILFTLDWESCFFLIASSDKQLLGEDVMSEEHSSFQKFIYFYGIREIILFTQFITIILGVVTSLVDKRWKKAYLLAGLFILELILVGQLHIYKGP